MKRFCCIIVALFLSLILTTALCEAGNVITIQQWLDCKGETEGIIVVCVAEEINPVLARVEDDTASVNLFGITVNGEFQPLELVDIKAGDVLVLRNPRYNEFEGSIEMADSVLVEKLTSFRMSGTPRTEADVYEFTASKDEEITVSNLIFNGDVTVSGEGQAVRFQNCEFCGNVICTAASETVVWILSDCTFAEDSRCILKSGVREANMDYAIPKFAICLPVDVECEDLGGVLVADDFAACLNGYVFTPEAVAYYQNEDGSIVPYAEGMEVAGYAVMHWWENGQEVIFSVGSK